MSHVKCSANKKVTCIGN